MIRWMRDYNANPGRDRELRFYCMDGTGNWSHATHAYRAVYDFACRVDESLATDLARELEAGVESATFETRAQMERDTWHALIANASLVVSPDRAVASRLRGRVLSGRLRVGASWRANPARRARQPRPGRTRLQPRLPPLLECARRLHGPVRPMDPGSCGAGCEAGGGCPQLSPAADAGAHPARDLHGLVSRQPDRPGPGAFHRCRECPVRQGRRAESGLQPGRLRPGSGRTASSSICGRLRAAGRSGSGSPPSGRIARTCATNRSPPGLAWDCLVFHRTLRIGEVELPASLQAERGRADASALEALTGRYLVLGFLSAVNTLDVTCKDGVLHTMGRTTRAASCSPPTRRRCGSAATLASAGTSGRRSSSSTTEPTPAGSPSPCQAWERTTGCGRSTSTSL